MKQLYYTKLALLAFATFFGGCATSDYHAYRGAQQNWPTAPGGFADTKYAVLTYYGPPERPYIVLGYLDATTAPVRRAGVVKYAAAKAKELGGDAIIVMSEGSEYRGAFNSGSSRTNAQVSGYTMGNQFQGYGTATTNYSGSSVPMFAGKAGVIVIKFK
jgi:hypothetical protein